MLILLIEDDQMLQRATGRLLAWACPGATIQIAATAERAIELLGTTAFDLVVSDYDLGPGQNGGHVLGWLRVFAPAMVARFIFLSGNEIVERLHSAALIKPASAKQLAAAIALVAPLPAA